MFFSINLAKLNKIAWLRISLELIYFGVGVGISLALLVLFSARYYGNKIEEYSFHLIGWPSSEYILDSLESVQNSVVWLIKKEYFLRRICLKRGQTAM